MATRIRLTRMGAKKRPFYRVVATTSSSPRDGKFLEVLGTYNPMLGKEDPNRVVLKNERVEHWLSVGASPSEKVAKFIEAAGLKNPQKPKAKKVAPKRAAPAKAEKKA